MNWNSSSIRRLIELAREEDSPHGDITSDLLIPKTWWARGEIIAKQNGVVAGLPFTERFFHSLARGCRFKRLVRDGAEVARGQRLAIVEGRARALLAAERPGMNALQRLSGIATYTRAQVRRLGRSQTKLLDTRKTLPGWRQLEKYAVRCGGATNHRMSLSEAVMIKDNHWRVARETGNHWVEKLRRFRRHRPGVSIQIEVQNEEDLHAALAARPSLVLLDNLPIPTLRRMIRILRTEAPATRIEVTGGVRSEDLPVLAGLGVDRISMGRLTHSAPTFDCSFEITHVDTR